MTSKFNAHTNSIYSALENLTYFTDQRLASLGRGPGRNKGAGRRAKGREGWKGREGGGRGGREGGREGREGGGRGGREGGRGGREGEGEGGRGKGSEGGERGVREGEGEGGRGRGGREGEGEGGGVKLKTCMHDIMKLAKSRIISIDLLLCRKFCPSIITMDENMLSGKPRTQLSMLVNIGRKINRPESYFDEPPHADHCWLYPIILPSIFHTLFSLYEEHYSRDDLKIGHVMGRLDQHGDEDLSGILEVRKYEMRAEVKRYGSQGRRVKGGGGGGGG